MEGLLDGYDSLSVDNEAVVAALRTLLAVSASSRLAAQERLELLAAVERQAVDGIAGVRFVGRGRITITQPTAALPVSVFNEQATALSVTLWLTSDSVRFPEGSAMSFTLRPGRNDLRVPVEASSSGTSAVSVEVTTANESAATVLSSGTLHVRYVRARGFGRVVLILAGATVALWWMRTLRRKMRKG